MSKINVTIAELVNAANTLNELNNSFKSKITEMNSLESELGAMWQGDSNNAFRTAYSSDREQWTTFSQVIDQYIQGLNRIAEKYSEAEGSNVDTARTRTSL